MKLSGFPCWPTVVGRPLALALVLQHTCCSEQPDQSRADLEAAPDWWDELAISMARTDGVRSRPGRSLGVVAPYSWAAGWWAVEPAAAETGAEEGRCPLLKHQ